MKRSYTQLIERLRGIERSSPFVSMHELGSFEANNRQYELYRIHLKAKEHGPVSVCISAGMHGDEPASVEAMAQFLEKNAKNEELLRTFSFVIFPCDNPAGYELDTRENASGVDLNREFNTPNPAREAEILMAAVEGLTFDHVYELHEDVDSYGFYMYELAMEPKLRVGTDIVRAISTARFPINIEECIEGLGAQCGVIAPGIRRMRKRKLPKAVYMHRLGAPHIITMETPGRALPIEERVEMQLIGLSIALEKAKSGSVKNADKRG